MRLIYNIKKGPKKWLDEIKSIKKEPVQIALGFSLGLFFSIIFTPGLSLAIILLLIAFLKVNKLAAVLGYGVNLPIFMPLNYYYSYRLGAYILGETASLSPASISFELVKAHMGVFFLGNLVLAFGISLACFAIVYCVFKYIVKLKQ